MLLVMKHNQTGLLFMSISLLLGVFSFELGRYIHSLKVLGMALSFVLMLIGIVLFFREELNKHKK